jgi:membrane-associated phospholipid phosphatase
MMSRRVRVRWVLLLSVLTCPGVHAEENRDPSIHHEPGFRGPSLFRSDANVRRGDSTSNLLRDIGTDFRNVVTRKENLVIVGVGLGAVWGARPFDDRVARWGLNSELKEETALDNVFETGYILGGGIVLVGGAAALYGAGKLLSKPGVEGLGRDLVRAQVVTQTFTLALKAAVGRERPDSSNNRSFPSGHASASFATATVLQRRYGPGVGIPAYLVAGYIAGSRLNEGAHYLSDAVFGTALGIMGARTVTIDLAKTRVAVHPAISPDGGGIQLTWLGAKVPKSVAAGGGLCP